MRSLVALRAGVLVALAVSCRSSPTAPGGGIVPATGAGGTTGQPASGGGGTTPNSTVVDIRIQDFMFAPAIITVKVGTTVRWTNNGPSPHTVTADMGGWGSGTLNAPMNGGAGMGGGMGDGMGGGGYGGGGSGPGGAFQFTFTQAGTYRYHCTIHPPSAYPGFTGTVTVTP
jgi:plastocyanin